MDEAKRPFLTGRDREYLDALYAALTERHGLSADLASASVRGAADALHRKRMCAETAEPPALFWCANQPEHATALAALAAPPRAKRSPSFAVLAVLATVAGALGARIVLDLAFRHLAPLRIGGPDLALVVVVAGGVLAAARAGQAARLAGGAGIVCVLVAGALIGAGAGRLLRSIGADATLVVLPFWFAVLVATACGALLWLLSAPREEIVVGG